jgi:hypothetical protein
MTRNTARNTPATQAVTRRKTPAIRPATQPATQPVTAADVPAPAAAVIDDPQTDVERASAAVSLVATRLAEAQGDLAELRRSLAEVAFLAEVNPAEQPALLELRSRLAAAEARVGELTAAESVGRAMASEAQRRALEARKDGDWQAAAEALAEAQVTAAALDSLLQQTGDLYGQIRRQMERAAAKVSPHLRRPEYNVPLPQLEPTLRLVLSNAGGPTVHGREVIHMEPAERAQASVAAVVTRHARQVMGYRPVTEEDSDRG